MQKIWLLNKPSLEAAELTTQKEGNFKKQNGNQASGSIRVLKITSDSYACENMTENPQNEGQNTKKYLMAMVPQGLRLSII